MKNKPLLLNQIIGKRNLADNKKIGVSPLIKKETRLFLI